jgi:hypothetical protein
MIFPQLESDTKAGEGSGPYQSDKSFNAGLWPPDRGTLCQAPTLLVRAYRVARRYIERMSDKTLHAGHDHSHHDHSHHDHGRCVETALARAEGLCSRRGAKLTPLRRQV